MIHNGLTRIEYKYGESIKIKPIFDVHLGNKQCDVAAFKSFLSASDDKTWFIGGGDLFDCIITSDLKRYRKSADTTESDAIIDEQLEQGYDLLSPYKHRILGLGSGNHEDTIIRRCGTDPIKRIAARLGCLVLGYSWLYTLLLTCNGGGGRKIVIRGHHGWGGGSRTQGADLTKFSRDVAYWDADIFLYGHVHRLQDDHIPRLSLVGKNLISRPKVLVICGSFLKTLSDSADPSYSERAGYPPIEIGGAMVSIKPRRSAEWAEIRVII